MNVPCSTETITTNLSTTTKTPVSSVSSQLTTISFPATTISTSISTSTDSNQKEDLNLAYINDYENSSGFLTSFIAYMKLVNEGKINVNIKV